MAPRRFFHTYGRMLRAPRRRTTANALVENNPMLDVFALARMGHINGDQIVIGPPDATGGYQPV